MSVQQILKENERFDRLIKENIDIIQSKDVFSFSLDAVLLANFVKIPNRASLKIVDACSGNGAVALMLSAKTKHQIVAIEYQERLYDMAYRTVQYNQLEEKVTLIHDDFNNALKYIKADSVDIISCNPPYFIEANHFLEHKNEHHALARHEITITLEEWIKMSSKLLKMGGKLYCIHRPERLTEIFEMMKRYKLEPKVIQFVHPKCNKIANMVLIEAIKYGKSGLKVLPSITVFNDNNDYLEPVRSMLYG